MLFHLPHQKGSGPRISAVNLCSFASGDFQAIVDPDLIAAPNGVFVFDGHSTVVADLVECIDNASPTAGNAEARSEVRTAAQHNRANVGIYASVLQGGKVRRGDSLRLE